MLIMQTMPLNKIQDAYEFHKIEDEEGIKLAILQNPKNELKAGRIHHGFRMDRTRLLNYEDEAVELSQGTLRESLHIATM